jgi:hypothetical protein
MQRVLSAAVVLADAAVRSTICRRTLKVEQDRHNESCIG